MTSGYILVVAFLVLGGLLATLGDRIGTKVGKARLSLFKLRPRNTATVVTIITGSLISASTMGILLATSASLRKGIFELDKIQKTLRIARDEVRILNTQKSQIEGELAKTRTEQAAVQQRLDATNQNFQQARTQLKNISNQATTLRSEIKSLLAERQALIEQRNQLNEQIDQLKSQVTQLKESVAQRDQELIKRGQTINERNQELAQKGGEIAQKNQELAQKNEEISQREARLKELEQQFRTVIAQREIRYQEREQQLKDAIAQREKRLQELEEQLAHKQIQVAERDQQLEEREKQLAFLEQNYQVLRSGNLALVRGQVLSFGVVRIVDPSVTNEAVDQLLREANRAALAATRSNDRNSNERLVQITKPQVEQLVNQIKDGKDYVVRILSAGNYVEGEKRVEVFADAALNQIVFQAGDILATVSTDGSTMNDEQLRQRLDQLLAASQFRARSAGILGVIQVGDGSPATLIRFIEQLAKSNEPLDVKAVAQDVTYTAGPLKMQLVATKNGQVIFGT